MRSGTKQVFSLLLLGLTLWLGLHYLLPALLPFLLGGALALLAEPGVAFLSRRLRLPRCAASVVGISGVFALICVLLTLLGALVFRELGALAQILPDMETTARDGLNALQGWLLSLAERTPQSIRAVLCRNVTELFSGGTALLDRCTRYALGLAGTVLTNIPGSALCLGTGLLSAFMISARLPQLHTWVRTGIARDRLEKLAAAFFQIRSTAFLWLTAQCKLAAVSAALLAAGFLLLRIAYAPLWALVVAAVDAFPLLGTGTVLIPWSIVCMLRQDVPRAAGLLGLYAVVALTRSVLEPRFVGRQLGLDPLVTLIALYSGFRLWGFAGMLLMPLAAITAARMLPHRTV